MGGAVGGFKIKTFRWRSCGVSTRNSSPILSQSSGDFSQHFAPWCETRLNKKKNPGWSSSSNGQQRRNLRAALSRTAGWTASSSPSRFSVSLSLSMIVVAGDQQRVRDPGHPLRPDEHPGSLSHPRPHPAGFYKNLLCRWNWWFM